MQLAAVAHLNHQLRAHAGRDEAFCRALAARLGVPFLVERADVAGLARAMALLGRSGGATRALRLPRSGARGLWRAPHRRGPHPRRSGRDGAVASRARGGHPRACAGRCRRGARSCVRLLDCSRDELRRLPHRAGGAVAGRRDQRRPRAIRATACGTNCCHCSRSAIARRWRGCWPVPPTLPPTTTHCSSSWPTRRSRPSLATAPGGMRLDVAALAALPLALQRRLARRALVLAGAARAPGHGDIERLLDGLRTRRDRRRPKPPACAWNVFPRMLSY